MSLGAAPLAIEVADVTVAYDVPVLEGVELEVERGEMVSLLGPSGCGKTTLLRAIAGLEPITSGTIRLGDTLVSGPGVHVAPERRRVGMVFQDWALFPHLSVAKNVAYGLERRERSTARVGEVLEMVGLAGYEDRAPHTLSGGQQQRVALARALAPKPAVLLLDEPFSNLDAALRVTIRTEVHRLLQELDVTAVFVTHDQDEAFVLGRQVAVLRNGRVEQWGRPADIYQRPANPWVAHFVGEANLIRAAHVGAVAHTPFGDVPIDSPGDRLGAEGVIDVLLRPEQLALGPVDDSTGGAEGRVSLIEYFGRDTLYEVALCDGPLVRCRLDSAPRFVVGDSVAVRYVGGTSMAYTPDAVADSGAESPRPWTRVEVPVDNPQSGVAR